MSAAPRLRLLLAGLAALMAGACTSADSAPPVASVSVSTSRTSVPIGAPVDLTFRFQVAEGASIDGDYTVFVHLNDAEGRRVWYVDHAPPVPTSEWKPGQVVEYTRTEFVPRVASVGDVVMSVGLYRGDERLSLDGPDEADRAGMAREYRVASLRLLPESENVFLDYLDGWYPLETDADDPGRTWRWTKDEAVVSFVNPRTDTTLYLEYEARPSAFPDTPQTVTVTANGETVTTVEATAATPELRRIPMPAAIFGDAEMVDLRLTLNRTFVPANLPGSSADTRDLGILVHHLFVDRSR